MSESISRESVMAALLLMLSASAAQGEVSVSVKERLKQRWLEVRQEKPSTAIDKPSQAPSADDVMGRFFTEASKPVTLRSKQA